MRSYFKKSLLIILLFCRTSLGDDRCSYQNLKPQDILAIKNKISEGMNRSITNYLLGRDIAIKDGIHIPVRIFEERFNNDYPESFVSTSFSLITKKNQNICHSNNNKECEFNDKFSLFFHTSMQRDNEGIPIKITCQVYSTILMNIVNITQNYKLEGIQIFGYIPIYEWEIPISITFESFY